MRILGYKPDVFEQARLAYSPFGNISNKGLDKDDKKGLFKRLENIKGKNEELLKEFSRANRFRRTAKNESDFNYGYAFYRFYRKFKRMLWIDSEHGELKEFDEPLSGFKNHKSITIKTKNCKNRIQSNVKQLYNYLQKKL